MTSSLRIITLALFVAAPLARADHLEELRRGSSGQAVADLVRLAEWCRKNKLYKSRLDLYSMILEFDTDHKIARRKLRFVRRKGGEWVRPRPLPEAFDRKPERLDDLGRRRREIAALYAAPLLSPLKKAGATTPDATRDRVFREIFLLDPDHARARAINGEVKDRTRWVLKETPIAAARRLVLGTRVRKLLAELPAPKETVPTTEEASYGVEWKAALQGSYWRMLYAADPDEAPACLRVADATAGVFDAVFGVGSDHYPGLRLMITDDTAKYRGILSRHPRMTKVEFDHAKDLTSTWLPRSRTCVSVKPHAAWRIEISARQPFWLLLHEYYALSGRHGWVWEGVGLYLTHMLTGYRTSTFVRVTRYAKEDKSKPRTRLWGELLPVNADWFGIAARRIERRETPDWKLMLSKDVNQMDVNDLLFSYMLGAYLIESQAGRAPGILKDVGANKASADVLQAALGMPLSRIESRVYRWIGEHGRG